MSEDLQTEEAFIASSFIEFHTEEPSSGEWIPMTEEEARDRWEAWLTEVRAAAWDEGAKAQADAYGMDVDTGPNPHRVKEAGMSNQTTKQENRRTGP